MPELATLPPPDNIRQAARLQPRLAALRTMAQQTQVDARFAYDQHALLTEKIGFLAQHCTRIYDFGKSSRAFYRLFKAGQAYTVDINQYQDYPDIVDDLCDLQQLPAGSADGIVCLSVVNHVYDPLQAVANLYRVLAPGGYLLLYVPFLFRYLAPASEYYQDYYRFTKSGVAYLLRDFTALTLYPTLGRYSTAANLFAFWKHWVTKRLGSRPSRWLDAFGACFGRADYDAHSVAGYYAWAQKPISDTTPNGL